MQVCSQIFKPIGRDLQLPFDFKLAWRKELNNLVSIQTTELALSKLNTP